MPPRSPELLLPSAAAWRTWLATHHATHTPINLVVNRAVPPVGVTTLTPSEALDEALCYGWIDSGGGRRDSQLHHLRFGPRRAPGKSAWSARNREHVARLEEQGRLAPPGEEAVRLARESGMWDAAYSSNPPSDLLAAVRDAGVVREWEARGRAERYAWCVRLGSAPWGSEQRKRKIEGILRELGAVVAEASGNGQSRKAAGTKRAKTSKATLPADDAKLSSASWDRSSSSTTSTSAKRKRTDHTTDVPSTNSPPRRSSRLRGTARPERT